MDFNVDVPLTYDTDCTLLITMWCCFTEILKGSRRIPAQTTHHAHIMAVLNDPACLGLLGLRPGMSNTPWAQEEMHCTYPRHMSNTTPTHHKQFCQGTSALEDQRDICCSLFKVQFDALGYTGVQL